MTPGVRVLLFTSVVLRRASWTKKGDSLREHRGPRNATEVASSIRTYVALFVIVLCVSLLCCVCRYCAMCVHFYTVGLLGPRLCA